MSWSSVRPYFEEVLTDRDYRLWTDGFGTNNVPSNVMDRAFHISINGLSGVRQNQTDQETEVSVELKTWYPGYADPTEAIDTAIAETQAIMQECVKPSRRVQTPGILTVVFNEAAVDPVGPTNDNAVMVTASYTVKVVIAV
jgi:hypothetical protein